VVLKVSKPEALQVLITDLANSPQQMSFQVQHAEQEKMSPHRIPTLR